MNRRTIYGAIAGSLVVAGAVAGVARAQSQPAPPDPSLVTLTPLPLGGAGCTGCSTLVKTEPATGFVGGCLSTADITYVPTLPVACYQPTSVTGYGAAAPGLTKFSFPASQVALSYSTLAPGYDSYDVLETCYPHDKNGTCPSGSYAVSRSCCDYGTKLVSLDGKTASGLAVLQ